MRCSQRCPQQTLFRKYTHKGTLERVQLTQMGTSGHLGVTSRGNPQVRGYLKVTRRLPQQHLAGTQGHLWVT